MRAASVDQDEARAALRASTLRTAALIGGIGDGSTPTRNLSWTVGETAAHLVVAARAFTDSLAGMADRWAAQIPAAPVYSERMAAVTTDTLSTVAERDGAGLSRVFQEAVDGFLEASAGRPPDERVATPWYGPEVGLPLGAATCLLLGEQVIHGEDLARTLDRRWPIRRDDALLMTHAIIAMLPITLDPKAARDADMTVAVHIRGGPDFLVRVRHGGATVEDLDSQRVDCHLSADPTAFARVGYGRMNQWQGILRGALFSWGRKPWVALQFRGLFVNP